MSPNDRKVVLVHGLWDSPKIFCGLVNHLLRDDLMIFAPHLPHKGGRVSLRKLAYDLDRLILERFGANTYVDVIGFSMGGVIARVWLQHLGGVLRTRNFLSVGCPQRGTLLAQPVPHSLLPGIAEMKCGSYLIRELNSEAHLLQGINCISYFCRWDLMVLPGWKAVLPIGLHHPIPVLTHNDLICHPKSLKIIANDFLSLVNKS